MEANKHIYITLFFISIGALCITSCGDNNVYLDCEKRIIYSPNNTISKISIFIKGKKEYYSIEKKKNRKGNNNIKLDSVGRDYALFKNMPRHHFEILNKSPIEIGALPFFPNEEYVIINISFGDAASRKIFFRTDADGKIIESWETDI